MDDMFEKMREAVLDGDEDAAGELAQMVLGEGINPVEAMENGFLKGIRESGALYEQGDYFLPDLVCSADAMKRALNILSPALELMQGAAKSAGNVVIATVQGDIHDIGKTIVAAMLTAGGFNVCDLGCDVSNSDILTAVKKKQPDLLALSALLTTTMHEQKNIIDMLETEGIRSNVKIIVGGAPINQAWAQSIGADGYSDNAVDAVRLAKQLMA